MQPAFPNPRLWRPRIDARRAAALAGAALALAFVGHAARASLDQPRGVAPVPVMPTGYEADAHFPGALLLEQPAVAAAPQAGTTGSAPLPAVPVPAVAWLGQDTIPAAAPFHLRGSALDSARALQCLTTAIYYEAASEPDDGQRAVAQVVLNRARHPAFPATVCGVVFQGSDRRVCQFSFACDGALARRPAAAAWERARRVAARALAGEVFAPVGTATHYHTYAVTPSWNRSLVMTGVFGAHFFHRWKGWWGTPAAFRDRHAGHEPAPGPLRPSGTEALAALAPAPSAMPDATVPPAIGAPAATAPTAAAAPATATLPQSALPRHADSGAPVVASAPADRLPRSEMLDRWKDTGTPLR